MPKYLLEGTYTPEGTKGLMKEGGSKRLRAIEKAFKGVNGKVEACYYAFGKSDIYIIVDFPNHVSAAAAALAVNSTGLAVVRTTVLLTVKDIDAATEKTVQYRGPGQ
jgi:uncharacterized protein with GYD domain